MIEVPGKAVVGFACFAEWGRRRCDKWGLRDAGARSKMKRKLVGAEWRAAS